MTNCALPPVISWAVVASPDPLQPALLGTIENNDGPPSDPSAWLVGRAAGYGGQITFSCVSNILAPICNLGSCPGLPTSALVADGPQKNNNEITVEMRETGD